MSSLKVRIIITSVLFVVAISLFIVLKITPERVANETVNSGQTNPSIYSKKRMNLKECEDVFVSVLKDFSVPDSNIHKAKPSKRKKNIRPDYAITLPGDIPFPVLMQSLLKAYSTFEVRVTAFEKDANNKYFFEVFTQDSTHIEVDFVINQKITRKKGSVGFILVDAENLSESQSNALFSSIDSVGIILTPSKTNVEYLRKIKENRKEGLILIDDKIEDLNFKFGSGFVKKRLVSVVSTYIEFFGDSPFLLIDDKSSIFSSVAFPFIRDEFEKGGKTVIPFNKLKFLSATKEEEYLPLIDEVIKSLKPTQAELIVVPLKVYLGLNEEIEKLRKTGVKILPPSRIIVAMGESRTVKK